VTEGHAPGSQKLTYEYYGWPPPPLDPSEGAAVGSRIPTWPYIPRKFTRQSHLASAIAPNYLFSSFRGPARVGSIPIARSTPRQRQATQGYKIGVKTLIRWQSLGNRRRGGGGLMASRFPALPRDSHVRSHAAVHKNKLCDSHAALVARAIEGGWTRTGAASHE
jgi:hypothetical protein